MRIDKRTLTGAAEAVLAKLGESPENAAVAAESLVLADMRGVSTHGVNLLRLMSQRTAAKMLELPTRVTTMADFGAVATLDGNNGLGPVAAYKALDLAMAKAEAFGVGMVALRNTNNIGALGCITGAAARRGFLAIVTTNGNPSVAPFGAAEPYFGTNPISIAAPRGGLEPLVLDMSSSLVARGKIRLASLSGKEIPLGWAIDAEGNPTTDPKKALKGCLLPLGGPKGSGLAMMIDMISGMLSGSAYGDGLRSFHELEGPTGVGASFICVDPARFVGRVAFEKAAADYAAKIKALRRQPGFDEILLPGELEGQKVAESDRDGIEVPEAVVEAIDGISAELGCPIRLAAPRAGGR